METRVVVNGRVLGRQVNGIPRYAMEIVKRIDRMKPPEMTVEMAVRSKEAIDAEFENIQVFEPKCCIGGGYRIYLGHFFC